jgi:hypothetical protein
MRLRLKGGRGRRVRFNVSGSKFKVQGLRVSGEEGFWLLVAAFATKAETAIEQP